MDINSLKRIFIGTPGKDYRVDRKDKKYDPSKMDPVPWGQRIHQSRFSIPPGNFGIPIRKKKNEEDLKKLEKEETRKE